VLVALVVLVIVVDRVVLVISISSSRSVGSTSSASSTGSTSSTMLFRVNDQVVLAHVLRATLRERRVFSSFDLSVDPLVVTAVSSSKTSQSACHFI
jgi:hypothetical protein